jgi:hypothetical protein
VKELFEVAKNLTPGAVFLGLFFLFFYLYSITGDILFLILSGVSIYLIPLTYLLKGPFEKWRSTQEESAAKELGDLIGSLPMYLRTRRYKHAYFEFLTAKHSIFDVKGLTTQGVFSLDLEKVFVELSVVTEPISQNNPLMPPQILGKGHRDIWAYLKDTRYKHLAIIGTPGCGKTTLLKFITLSLAQHTWRTRKQVPSKLPIFLFLRDHATTIADKPDTSLLDLIHQSLIVTKETAPTPPRWFESYLKRGHCLIMLDGLDEVGDLLLRKKVVAWISKTMEIYHKNRFIVSARPHGYHSNPIQGMTQLQVQNFNSEQIQKFIENWYQATEVMSQQRHKDDKRVRFAAQQGAADLLKRIQSTPDLAALALNPLLLTMIANVHRWRSSLPGRRVELYAEMCEVFLGKRHLASGIEDGLTPAQKQSVLEVLAYKMMQQKKREMSLKQILGIVAAPLKLIAGEMEAETFIHLVRDGSGILIERELETYAFSHKTFQEFLAAVYIEKEKRLSYILGKLDEDWWHETIRLYCARNDATSVITNCLMEAPPPLKRLVLAIECADEALKLDGNVRARLNEIIEEGLDSDDKERRTIAAKAKLSLRLAHFSRIDDTRYADNTLITHAEFQLFLDEQPQYTPDYWSELEFPKGKAIHPIVGISPAAAEAFCAWLNDTQAIGWNYRLPKQNELEPGHYWIKTEEAYLIAQPRPIQQFMSDWIKIEAATVLESEELPKELLRESITINCHQFHISDIFRRALYKFNIQLVKSHSISPLAKTLARTSTEIFNLARKRDQIPSLPLSIALDLARELVLSINNELALVNDLGSTPELPLKLTNALVSALATTLLNNLQSASASASDLISARANVSANARVSARDLVNILNRTRLSTLLASTGTEDFTGKLTSLTALCELLEDTAFLICLLLEWFIWGPSYSPNLGPRFNKDLASIRQNLLLHLRQHFVKQPKAINRLVGNSWQTWRDELDEILTTYAQFATLENRRLGKWEAYEGLQLIREKTVEEPKEQPPEKTSKKQEKATYTRTYRWVNGRRRFHPEW